MSAYEPVMHAVPAAQGASSNAFGFFLNDVETQPGGVFVALFVGYASETVAASAAAVAEFKRVAAASAQRCEGAAQQPRFHLVNIQWVNGAEPQQSLKAAAKASGYTQQLAPRLRLLNDVELLWAETKNHQEPFVRVYTGGLQTDLEQAQWARLPDVCAEACARGAQAATQSETTRAFGLLAQQLVSTVELDVDASALSLQAAKLANGEQTEALAATLDGKPVAVRVLGREVTASSAEQMRRRVLAQHPGLVAAKGVCLKLGVWCLVLEACAWPSLASLLENRSFSTQQRLAALRQVAAALAFLQQQGVGVVLRAEGVLFGDGQAKLAEAGCAVQAPFYAAPQDGPASAAYAFGVLFWELVTHTSLEKSVAYAGWPGAAPEGSRYRSSRECVALALALAHNRLLTTDALVQLDELRASAAQSRRERTRDARARLRTSPEQAERALVEVAGDAAAEEQGYSKRLFLLSAAAGRPAVPETYADEAGAFAVLGPAALRLLRACLSEPQRRPRLDDGSLARLLDGAAAEMGQV